MATGTKAAKKSTKKAQKAAPAPEPEEELEDLEELEEDEVEEAPKKKGGAQQEVTFGASDLARHLTEKHGKTVSPRELRTLIRKMARDGSGRVTREITPGNRTRYNWSGIDDPEVQAIIKAYEDGELEADKQQKLAELKERKAKKDAEAGKGKTGKKAAKKKAPEPVDEVEEDEDEDLELDDEEE